MELPNMPELRDAVNHFLTIKESYPAATLNIYDIPRSTIIDLPVDWEVKRKTNDCGFPYFVGFHKEKGITLISEDFTNGTK